MDGEGCKDVASKNPLRTSGFFNRSSGAAPLPAAGDNAR
jgi:hypothetical protein